MECYSSAKEILVLSLDSYSLVYGPNQAESHTFTVTLEASLPSYSEVLPYGLLIGKGTLGLRVKSLALIFTDLVYASTRISFYSRWQACHLN